MGLSKTCKETIENLVDSFMERYFEQRTTTNLDAVLTRVTKKLFDEMSRTWNELPLSDRAATWQHIVNVDVVRLEAATGEPAKIAMCIMALFPMVNHGDAKCPEEEGRRYTVEYFVQKYKKGTAKDILAALKHID